jgi:hypothetical protein
MSRRRAFLTPSRAIAAASLTALAVSGGLALAATSSSPVIRACASKKTGALRLASKCKRTERFVSWNKQGITGPAGLAGASGSSGGTGAQGKEGTAGANGAARVVVRTAEVTIEDKKTGAVTANCNPGERATGGGVEVGTGSFKNVWSPIPGGKPEPAEAGETPTGWRGFWNNESGVTDTFHVYVVCAAP